MTQPVAIFSNALVDDYAQNPSQADPFEQVFQTYWEKVYTVLFRLVGERSEAEDLAQEVFWRLSQRAPSILIGDAIGGWLYRVATRLGLNALRARRRRRNYERQAGLQELERQANLDPSAQFEREETRQRVQATLARMKPRHAQLLTLRYSGLSYAELAAALGVSPASIGTMLVRAEREFERLYAKCGGER